MAADAFRALASAVPWRALRAAIAELPARERAAVAGAWLSSGMESVGAPGAFGLPGFAVVHVTRPLNRPERRLAGVAAIAGRVARTGLGEAFVRALDDARPPRRLVALLTVTGAIGRSRAIEIATNAVLPWLAASGLETEALRAYAALGLPARYGNVRHLHEALASEVPLGARRQQGMLYLLRQYCTQGGCGRCPLS